MPLTSPVSDNPRLMQIVKYGYPTISKVLTKPADPVTPDMFDHRLRQLIVDMFHTMYTTLGVGLAAPQIGLSLRVAVIDISSGQNPAAKIVLINPEIFDGVGEQVDMEGCLSLPGFREKVKRYQSVRVNAQNERGEWYGVYGEGLLARALQHEVDHLNGTLFIDHLSALRRMMIKDKIKKMIRRGRW